jgi:probable HAF family extracellular repeat protein
VVVGVSGSTAGERGFRWTDEGMTSLGTLPGGVGSRAFNVSADGSTVVGFSRTPGRERAFRWTEMDGMQDLGALPSDFPPSLSIAYAVNADGSRVGGRATTGLESHAFLWTAELGLVDLNYYLPGLGVDMGNWVLQDVFAISADGMTMAGNGINAGQFEGWVLHLGDACPADFNTDDAVNSQDFFDFLTAFFAGAPRADFNADALVNSQDFFDFLTAFFAGC